jgi:hypothetical protein
MPAKKDEEEAAEDVAVSERTQADEEQPVPEPYVDPYKQVINPLELPANPVAAAAYPPGNVSADAPISEERAAQAEAAIQSEQDKIAATVEAVPDHPATATEEEEPAPAPQKAAARDRE